MAHQISYAYEKFMVALDSLAASDAPLKRRLIYAYDQLHRLETERSFGDYPEMAEAFREIDAAYRTVATGPEGGAKASIDAATGEQDVKLAERILSLFLKIAREDALLHAEKRGRG